MTVLVRLFVLLIALAGVAIAKQDPREARDRWERMPHDERAKFVERFEQYRTLPPEKRAKFAERAKRLEGLRAELVKELPAEVRARLEQMTPLERAEALREFMERRLEERGRHVRGFLPRELRERIENAPPDQREPLVREFCENARREDGRRMLDALARRLELAPEEVARIEALPEGQHFEAVMELRRRVIERDVAEEGLPTWLEASEWAEVQKL
ncbi:MAG: DUF3106 domain-containing protein, partial [Planctomycetes bacterium]|nr:DUF3106 domain-containing protein [Planctomycetota bacterium]